MGVLNEKGVNETGVNEKGVNLQWCKVQILTKQNIVYSINQLFLMCCIVVFN